MVAFRPASGIAAERAKWAADLYPIQVPIKELTLLVGRPGSAKSLFGYWLAAQITRGTMQGAFYGQPRKVVFMDSENSWAHNIVPRLWAAGADLSLCGLLEGVDKQMSASFHIYVPRLMDAMAEAIGRENIGMVVPDPLLSSMSPGTNPNKLEEVRSDLEAIKALAEQTSTAWLCHAHFNKMEGRDILDMIGGSVAFGQVPRAIIGMVRDTDTTGLMAEPKNTNGIVTSRSMTYAIESVWAPVEDGWASTPVFRLGTVSERNVRDLLDTSGGWERRKARDFLLGAFTLSRVWRREDLMAEAKANGHTQRTVDRVLQEMGLRAQQIPPGSKAYYYVYEAR
jgi:hypothetical protein